ncbi:elongation factor 4 [candidate division WWE3 bacterium]|nr:elongation factor 4 [candidate division WWE3 bacterium]MBT7350362.1 elongation factor 4 [candidate division WWE3 bacterium]
MNQKNIRNFCIIAHIDHGKSTLADRFLEVTGTIKSRDLKNRTLDSMELEQEKGITIKLKAVRMDHEVNGEEYQLNLIDTPGHVDFSYEVSRSLAACEGAVLVVDASQGIQAQTVSNVYKALEADLTIIPVLNKIDLTSAEVDKVTQDLIDTFGFKREEILFVSAKTGEGVELLLEEVVAKVAPPTGDVNAPARALIFDTFYDEFLGVVAIIKVETGVFSKDLISTRGKIKFFATRATSVPEDIGVLIPTRKSKIDLHAGEVGFIATGLKDINQVRVGDTVFLEAEGEVESLPGYKEVKPFVFVSIFPIDNDKFPDLREALQKLALSDSALSFEPESSTALGFGFRCGFLGLLHADIIQERLEREYNLDLIASTPSVEYEVYLTNGDEISIKTAADYPDRTRVAEVKEPWIMMNIVTPAKYVGGIITLCEGRRGIQRRMEYPSQDRVVFEYEIPLVELVFNFFDELKTISSGFASLDYDFLDYRTVDVVKVDIMVHGDVVEPLSRLVLKSGSEEAGREILKKLKEVIPRQQFKVALQAAIGGKIIAREDISAAGKHVLGGIYGGHRERKDKLLDRQKKGKDRLKKVGKVSIPQEAFRQVLRS